MIDQVGAIGPFDKAQLGGLTTLPLSVLVCPLAAMAVLTAPARRQAMAAATLIGLGSLLVVTTVIVANTTRVGCRSIDQPSDVLPAALIVGLGAAAFVLTGAFAAVTVGRRLGHGSDILTFVIAVPVGIAVITATAAWWSVLFRLAACAPA